MVLDTSNDAVIAVVLQEELKKERRNNKTTPEYVQSVGVAAATPLSIVEVCKKNDLSDISCLFIVATTRL